MSCIRVKRRSFVAVMITVLCAGSGLVSRTAAATYYVSPPPLGNDGNPGTASRPFATPQKAANRVVAGDTVLVNPGVYGTYPGSSCVFTCTASGTAENPIVFQANGDRTAVILDNAAYGNARGSCANLMGAYQVLDGFTLRNAEDGVHIDANPNYGANGLHCTVKNCEIYGMPGDGVFVYRAAYSELLDNIIHDCGTDEHTHGIYISESHHSIDYENHIVRGNTIFDCSQGLWVNPNQGNDNKSAGLLVENNVFYNNKFTDIAISYVWDSIIRNNVCYSKNSQGYGSWGHIQFNTMYGAVPNYQELAPRNNTIVNNTCISYPEQPMAGIQIFRGSKDNVVFNNVLIVNQLTKAIVDEGANNTKVGNYTAVFSEPVLASLFVGPTTTPGDCDFHLKPTSPSVDAGLASATNSVSGTKTAPLADFDGNDRPQPYPTGNYDQGAYEYSSEPTTPGPPRRPEGLVVVRSATPACVTLAWQPNGETDIGGYVVYYGSLSVAAGQATIYADSIDVGNVTSKEICGLSAGRYYFAVKAYNTSGKYSVYSAERDLYATGSEPPTAYEVSRWGLDEASGTTAQDSWGSTNGTLANGPVWRPTGGEINGALEFDGADDYVDLGTMNIADGPGLSMAFWIRADDFDNPSSRFVSKASGTAEADHYWLVGTVNSTGLRFRLKTGGVTTSLETTAGEIQAYAWYHIAATYDGQKMRIFRNGSLVGEINKTGIVDASSTAQAALGSQPPNAGGGSAFDGMIDDVRIYRRALSEAEIDSLIALATNTPPIARVAASTTSGFAPLGVTFDSSTSTDTDGDPLSYSWAFGDNGTGTGSSITHVYNNAGTYQAVVTVTDDGGKTDAESIVINVSESTGPPTIPLWQSLFETNPGCAMLEWQPNTEPDLDGYRVYYGRASREAAAYSDSIDVGNTTTREQCGLTQGFYYFALRAYNMAGEFSGFSAERQLYIAGPDVTTPAISIVRPARGTVGVDPRDVEIYFLVSDGQSGVDSTTVTVSVNGSPAAGMTLNGDPTTYAVACEPEGTLPSNSTITVSVSARDRASPRNEVHESWSFTTSAAPPAAPTGLQGQQANAGCLSVTWRPNTEADLAGYVVYFGTSSVALGQTSEYSDSVSAGSTTSQTICGLMEGTYYVAVRAKNTSGQYSPFSGEISVVVAPVVPEGPSPPQQVQANESSPGCLSVIWAANPEPDVAGYVLYYGPASVVDGGVTQYEDSLDVGVATSKQLCGFLAGTLYVALRAYNTGGVFSDFSTEKRVDILGEDVDPPTVLVASPSDGAVGVPQNSDIMFVVSDDRSGVDANTIRVRINGSAETHVTYSGDPSQYAVVCKPSDDLPELTLVTVEVSASDLAPTPNTNTVTWSFTTGRSRPSDPQGIAANGTDTGCATVSWSANPEPDVIGYRIYFGMTSVASGQASAYDDSVSVGRLTVYTLCGLLDGTHYFALRARNSLGYLSGLSQEVSTTVTNPIAEGPAPPQQVRVSEVEPGCVLVKWRANSEPDVTGYVVYHRQISTAYGGSSEYIDSVDVGDVTEKKICGFGEGTYCFAVRAYNTAGQHSAFSTEKWLDVIGPDNEGPKVVVGGPVHGAVDVRPNVRVFFVVSDRKSGVDASSLAVLINGSPPKSISLTGDSREYAVVCDLNEPLPLNSIVRVEVTVHDLATPSNATVYRWSFSTGSTTDVSSPIFFDHTPAEGATGVSPNAVVRVGVRDDVGIDTSNISLLVNGSPVTGASVREEANGDVFVEYTNPSGFGLGSTVEIEVLAYDLAANQAVLTFSFQTATATEAGPSVAIVPDGYWADDPARPLEVRNIPPGWQVRIFDTSGLQVRAFTNTGETTVDWAWDFANGHGHPVAKSMYLVRVLDTGGSVKKSGKFVVQTAAH